MKALDTFRRKFVAVAGLALALLTMEARAGDLTATGKKRWLTIASSQDQDEAIGIARYYGGQSARVVSSKSGWFAVIAGPVVATSIKQFHANYGDWPEIPEDARLSKGENYVAAVWLPTDEKPATELTADAPAKLSDGGITIIAKLVRDGDNSLVKLTGNDAAQALFNLETPSNAYADFGTAVQIAWLDDASLLPQVIITRSTGGAHCCVDTVIATGLIAGRWKLIETGLLDGDGFRIENVDGKGAAELLSADNSFFYAFDSYAASFAPLRISKLKGETLEDVTADPRWRSRIAQDLAVTEFLAKMNPELWRSNGFLAAWVATKIGLGQGQEAWARMLKTYERNSDFGPQSCSTGQSIEDCPQENLRLVPFPEALAAHLKEHGYIPVPDG